MFNQWSYIHLWFNCNTCILISIRTTIIMSIFQRTLPNRGHHLDSQITEYLEFIFTEVASRHEHAGQRSNFNCEVRCSERSWRLIHDRCSPRSAPQRQSGKSDACWTSNLCWNTRSNVCQFSAAASHRETSHFLAVLVFILFYLLAENKPIKGVK